MVREKSAGVVVFAGSPRKFLLLHYPKGHWGFPKGNVEKGESDEQAAMRELMEETGLTARLIPGFKESVSYFYRAGARSVHKTVIFFLGQSSGSGVRLSFEHIGFEWLPYQEAMERLTFENSRVVLKKAIEFMQETA